MAHYLIEVGYTPQSWSNQIDTQANVVQRITPAPKACGGRIECIYYAFGIAMGSSGALRVYRTTPLLSVDQGLESLRKAEDVRKAYTPPVTISLVEQKQKTPAR